MQKSEYRSALIVGTGPGLSASLARLFAKHGLAVSVAARQTDKLAALTKETRRGPCLHAADPRKLPDFRGPGPGPTPDVVVYNASNRVRGPLVDLPPDDVKRAIRSAFAAFWFRSRRPSSMLPSRRPSS